MDHQAFQEAFNETLVKVAQLTQKQRDEKARLALQAQTGLQLDDEGLLPEEPTSGIPWKGIGMGWSAAHRTPC